MDQVSREERDLFRQAVTEAFIRKFDRELADCPFSADCSEEHLSKMEAIVENSARAEHRKKRRKWIVALLVAAALLLTACTVYAYRGEIREFVEKVYVYQSERIDGNKVQRIKIGLYNIYWGNQSIELYKKE